MRKERFLWIDWIKTLSIYLIIAGHLSVPGDRFLYVFNVPVFFILSGYLFKDESWEEGISKAFWNLFIPMMGLFLINFLFRVLGHLKGFDLHQALLTPIRALFGMQGENYSLYGGLGALWFVYTLILCRVTMLFLLNCSRTHFEKVLIIVNLLFCTLCVIYNHKGHYYFNSVLDLLLAFPFFSIGYYSKPFIKKLTGLKTRLFLLSIPFLVSIIWLCGRHEEVVYLYRCSYGHSLLHCLLGGIAGFVLILFVSLIFERVLPHWRIVEIIGQGTIIILGLHVIFVILYEQHLGHWSNSFLGFERYFVSLLILLFFIPIIIITKKHFPLLFGKLRVTP